MKKINDNIFKRAVSFLLLLSLVVVFSFVPINDTSAAETTAGLKVNATSNFFPEASVTVDEGEEYVTVTYFINSTKDMLNTQWTLSYDPACLEFDSAVNMNATGSSNLMPMVDDLVCNAAGGKIMANATSLELYKFGGKGSVPFIMVTFKVIGSGSTVVNLNVEFLTLSLLNDNTSMSDPNQEELVIYNGNVKEVKNQPKRNTSVYVGLYTDYYGEVSNEEDIYSALESGVYKIKLTDDITLLRTLDLSDKIITLDLNGHVLTGNVKLADNSVTAKSTLFLIDSSTASDGVLNGEINLTRSYLYANGGTVTGLVSMNDSVSKIFCTSDTPTVFKGYVGDYGEIHGGIFYGDMKKSCIKEKYVTFMNGEDTYAYEVVSSDNNTVAPVAPDPTKYGYQNFDGWYNGEAAYSFGSALSEDITLIAKFSNPTTFNITYDLDGGTATNPISYNVESDTITLNNPTKTDYTFTGWSGTDLTGDDNVTVTIQKGSMGSRSYTAHFSPNSYTVSFDIVGGSTISDKTGLMWTDEVLDGVTAPTKDGWEFTGWKYADKPVTANTKYSDLVTDDKIAGITLVAQWKDINAPTGEISIGTKKWTEFRDDITFSLFFKDKQTVTITASDNVTTSPTIKYYLSDKKLTESEVNADDIAWETYTGAFDITADGKKIIYAKATDDAGKVTIVNSEGIVIYKDSTPAVADIRYTYKENANKSVAISLNGNTVKAITNGTKVLTKDTDYTVSADGTITIMAAYLDTLAASDTPYTLTVTYNPQGVEYTGGEESVAPAQTTISVTVAKADNSTTEKPAVTVTQAEIQENSVKLNTGTSMVWKNNKITLKWETISGADGYDIFAAKCRAKMTSKSLVKTVKGEKSSAALTKIAGKKLSGKEEYKVRIKAYKLINGKKVYIGSSQLYHMAGKSNKTYTNAKKITVSKKSVTLKVGKTSQIKAKIVKQSNKKKLLSKAHGPVLRYCSTDNSIATVTANGKITAKEKGSCYIYVIALNGVKTKIKVKVK